MTWANTRRALWRGLLLLGLLVVPGSLLAATGGTDVTAPTIGVSLSNGCYSVLPSADDTSGINAALTYAQAGPERCVRLKPGIYRLHAPAQPGVIFDLALAHLDFGGAGAGKTIIQWDDNAIYPDAWTQVFWLDNDDQAVHDLSIAGGANPGGPGNWGAVECTLGCRRAHLYNLDISGVYGTATAGGDGIGLYAPWNQDSGDVGALVENNYIHDSPRATGIDISGDNNRVLNNRIERIGSSFTQHGIYLSGGKGNLFSGNRIVDAAGYCFAAHEQAPEHHAGGNVFSHNECLNYHAGAIVVDGLDSTGINPNVPAGRNLTDSFLIDGNWVHQEPGFALTNGIGIWVNGVTGVQITNNILQDVSHDTWIDTHLADGAVILDNHFNTLTGPNSSSMIFVGPHTLVQGNVFEGVQANYAVIAQAGTQVVGNYFNLNPNTEGVQIAGDGVTVAENTILASAAQVIQFSPNTHGWTLRDNTVGTTGPLLWRIDPETPGVQGRITGNQIMTGTASLYGPNLTNVQISDNSGLFAVTSTAVLAVLPSVGEYPAGAFVAWQSGAVGLATGPTFAGVSVQAGYDYMSHSLFVTQPGAVVQGACVQGAFVLGNVGILNGAGCVTDTGTNVPPTNTGWARFVPGGVEIHPGGSGSVGELPALPVTATPLPSDTPIREPPPTLPPAATLPATVVLAVTPTP